MCLAAAGVADRLHRRVAAVRRQLWLVDVDRLGLRAEHGMKQVLLFRLAAGRLHGGGPGRTQSMRVAESLWLLVAGMDNLHMLKMVGQQSFQAGCCRGVLCAVCWCCEGLAPLVVLQTLPTH